MVCDNVCVVATRCGFCVMDNMAYIGLMNKSNKIWIVLVCEVKVFQTSEHSALHK